MQNVALSGLSNLPYHDALAIIWNRKIAIQHSVLDPHIIEHAIELCPPAFVGNSLLVSEQQKIMEHPQPTICLMHFS